VFLLDRVVPQHKAVVCKQADHRLCQQDWCSENRRVTARKTSEL